MRPRASLLPNSSPLTPELLRIALASAELGAFALESGGGFRWDARCKALLALTVDETPLEVFLESIEAGDRDHVRRTLLLVDTDFADEFQRKGAAQRFEIRGRSVANADGAGRTVVGTLRDVTDQRSADHTREARIDELTRTVLFSEMFVGILAHDLRQPLSGMMMAAQLATKSAPADGPLPAILARIQTMGTRTMRMTDQLLDFTCARVGSGIPLRVDTTDLMDVANDVVSEIAVAHPECTVSVAGTGVTTGSWDADRLAQALSNVVGNAVEHGEVAAGVRVHVDGTRADDVIVEVWNQGLIPAALLPTLFHPFRAAQQSRERSRGVGLGLFVTRQIAVAHGGDVEISSSSEGTKVCLRLPRRPARREVPHAAPDHAAEEIAALERFSAVPRATTTVTAQLFGAVAIQERSPHTYERIFEQYDALLDRLIQHRVFKESQEHVAHVSTELRAIAERLGTANAGAREVAELHAGVIRKRTKGIAFAKSQALITEGRMMAFELMGHLVSYYRRRASFL